MIIANIAVDRLTARVCSSAPIPRGIVGAQVALEFRDPIWETLGKTAVFRGAVTRDVPVTGNQVTIPWETVTRAGGKLYLGLYGTDGTGALALPTVWAELGDIVGAADPSGDLSVEATPALWEQTLALIGDPQTLKTQEKANLVGAINEIAIRNGLDPEQLRLTVEEALAVARDSGDFDGEQGPAGKDGISPVISTERTEDVDGSGRSGLWVKATQGTTDPDVPVMTFKIGNIFDGVGIDSVTVETLEPGQNATASITAPVAKTRVLNLGIPRGADGSENAIPLPDSAQVGQYIVVSAVDENGRVTATQAVTGGADLPEAGEAVF